MGNGPKMEEIKNKVSNLKLNDKVYFLGNISNIKEIIQGMDIMLFPSLFEGLPNVVIEWQAAGLPCIISDKITKECSISDSVYFTPIDDGVYKWIEVYNSIDMKNYNRKQISKENCMMLKNNGFDIDVNTEILEKDYIELIKKYSN